jgi:hypothetical protein
MNQFFKFCPSRNKQRCCIKKNDIEKEIDAIRLNLYEQTKNIKRI